MIYSFSTTHVNIYERVTVFNNCDLGNFQSIEAPIMHEKDEKSSVKNIPMESDKNIFNKLLSHSEMEALVFKAKIVLKEPENFNREFIVKYFLRDQSFSVSETKNLTASMFHEC